MTGADRAGLVYYLNPNGTVLAIGASICVTTRQHARDVRPKLNAGINPHLYGCADRPNRGSAYFAT